LQTSLIRCRGLGVVQLPPFCCLFQPQVASRQYRPMHALLSSTTVLTASKQFLKAQ
jgi:hypothetical protein